MLIHFNTYIIKERIKFNNIITKLRSDFEINLIKILILKKVNIILKEILIFTIDKFY